MRKLLSKASLIGGGLGGIIIWWSWPTAVGLLLVSGAAALYLDFTCPHQRRLYWDKKEPK